MADRLVKVLENGRLVTRGLSRHRNGAELLIDPDESLDVTINWSDWLGDDIISSVTNEANGPSVASASNTTTEASFNVASDGGGFIQHRITTANGLTKELRVYVRIAAGEGIKDYSGAF